jgi:hypothetical protein
VSRYITAVHLFKQSSKSALKTKPLKASAQRALLRTLVTVASKLEEVASKPKEVYALTRTRFVVGGASGVVFVV